MKHLHTAIYSSYRKVSGPREIPHTASVGCSFAGSTANRGNMFWWVAAFLLYFRPWSATLRVCFAAVDAYALPSRRSSSPFPPSACSNLRRWKQNKQCHRQQQPTVIVERLQRKHHKLRRRHHHQQQQRRTKYRRQQRRHRHHRHHQQKIIIVISSSTFFTIVVTATVTVIIIVIITNMNDIDEGTHLGRDGPLQRDENPPPLHQRSHVLLHGAGVDGRRGASRPDRPKGGSRRGCLLPVKSHEKR